MKTIAALLLVCLSLLLPSGCALLNKEAPVAQAALNCAEASLAAQAPDIITKLLPILTNLAEDWEKALADLGPVGQDVLTCAEQAVEKSLVAAAPVGPAPPSAAVSTVEMKRQLALVRVRYLLAKVKPKAAK